MIAKRCACVYLCIPIFIIIIKHIIVISPAKIHFWYGYDPFVDKNVFIKNFVSSLKKICYPSYGIRRLSAWIALLLVPTTHLCCLYKVIVCRKGYLYPNTYTKVMKNSLTNTHNLFTVLFVVIMYIYRLTNSYLPDRSTCVMYSYVCIGRCIGGIYATQAGLWVCTVTQASLKTRFYSLTHIKYK